MMKTMTISALVAVAAAATLMAAPHSSSAAANEETDAESDAPAEFKLSSPSFEHGMPIPLKHTGQGVDVSPPLQWIEPPESTKSFALIADDPDAPMGTWVHWVIYNIPADTRELKEALPTLEKLSDGTLQGVNDFGKIGYNGPMPPPGKPHRYFFKLYALDTTLDLPARSTKKELEKAMKDHILEEAKLLGTFVR